MIKNSNEVVGKITNLEPLHQQSVIYHDGYVYIVGLYDDNDDDLKRLISESFNVVKLLEMDSAPLYVVTDNSRSTLEELIKLVPVQKNYKHEESYQLRQIAEELKKLGFTAQESVHASKGMLDLANGISR